MAKGIPNPKREVPCIRCGCTLLRATYFDKATCVPCRVKHYRRNYGVQMRRFREQARRYRILVHLLGWPDTEEGFAEMVEEIKASPMAFRKTIEDRLVRKDMHFEKLARRRFSDGEKKLERRA